MASNAAFTPHIYTGFWTNWSRGSIYGATLTLTRSDANTLIAFIAFFVAWVGTCFWRIICFIVHYSCSSKHPQDALYYQRQAVLRNASEPEAGVRLSAMLFLAWRRGARRAFWRLFFLLVLSLACVVVSALSSLFSPRISDVGSEVLLTGENCRVMGTYAHFADKQSDPYEAYLVPLQLKRTTQVENAANYALQCYSGNGGGELDCGAFVQRRLPLSVQMNASCPFSNSICKTQDKNLLLDTGLLDSHEHFGINAPPSDRFLYRRVMHCGPLVTDGHVYAGQDTRGNPVTKYIYEDGLKPPQFTYSYLNQTANVRTDYDIQVVPAFYSDGRLVPGNSLLEPSQELAQGKTDADIALYFLSANAVSFTERTEDPWYAANVPFNLTTSLFDKATNSVVVENITQYFQTEAASPLGCRLQDQFCNPNKPLDVGCSTLGPIFDPVTRSVAQFDEDYEAGLARLGWFTFVLADMTDLTQVVKILGPHSLLARYRRTNDGSQGKIPDNQWMLDVQHWLEINLASMQSAAVLAAMGPRSAVEEPLYSIKPNLTVERQMCRSQKILSKNHASFSVAGLIITFAVGLTVVIVSYMLHPLMACLQRVHGIKEYQRLEWNSNGFLQLQRIGFEELGQGTWSETDCDVPVTKRGQRLAGLDLTDPTHPTIARYGTDGSLETNLSLLKSKSSYE